MPTPSDLLDQEAMRRAFGTGDEPVSEDDESALDSEESEFDAAAATSGPDYESEHNPYRRQVMDLEAKFNGTPVDKLHERFGGLQASLQREVEKARTEEARRLDIEARMIDAEIAKLPEEQQPLVRAQIDAERRTMAQQSQLSEREELMQGFAREFLIYKLSSEKGVPKDKLARFEDPNAMVGYAEAYTELVKAQRKESRKEKKADKFDNGGTSPAGAKRQSYDGDFDAAAYAFGRLPLPGN